MPGTDRRSRRRVEVTFEDRQGREWRVYDFELLDRTPALVAVCDRRATHRGFEPIGWAAPARRYAFLPHDRDGVDEHDLNEFRLQRQLDVARVVKARLPRAAPAPR